MAATAEQVTAEPGLGGTDHTLWGWKTPSAATLQSSLAQGSHPVLCILDRNGCWPQEKTKCLFEKTLYLGHRAIPFPQVSPFLAAKQTQAMQVSLCDWVCWFVDCGPMFITIIASH